MIKIYYSPPNLPEPTYIASIRYKCDYSLVFGIRIYADLVNLSHNVDSVLGLNHMVDIVGIANPETEQEVLHHINHIMIRAVASYLGYGGVDL